MTVEWTGARKVIVRVLLARETYLSFVRLEAAIRGETCKAARSLIALSVWVASVAKQAVSLGRSRHPLWRITFTLQARIVSH